VFETLTRDNIEEHVVREMGRPKWRDARVRVVQCDGRRAIFKDVRDRHPLFRFTFGRRLIAREFRIYQALDGVEGVPRPYRKLDGDGFLIEQVDGQFLSRKKINQGLVHVTPAFYDRCLRLVGELHSRGVAHLDLRSNKNFLFGEGDRAYVVDFASAVRVPRWVPFGRLWISLLGAFDRAGVLKLKERLSPAWMSDEEKETLRRFERTRAILFPPILVMQAFRRRRRSSKS